MQYIENFGLKPDMLPRILVLEISSEGYVVVGNDAGGSQIR
jgi:hypothetical protein